MFKYFKVDKNGIVCETFSSSFELNKDSSLIPTDENLNEICGKKWNGSTFEEVPTEESDNVSRETSMTDLEDYCLTIIELLTEAKEGE